MSIETLIYTLIAVIAIVGAVGMCLFIHAVYKEVIVLMAIQRAWNIWAKKGKVLAQKKSAYTSMDFEILMDMHLQAEPPNLD
jgi:hypothetical protein